MVAMLLDQIERGIGREHPIELDAQIESASGLVNCESIAFASPRLRSLVFGPGDYAASVGMPTDGIGAFDDWDDHVSRSSLALRHEPDRGRSKSGRTRCGRWPVCGLPG